MLRVRGQDQRLFIITLQFQEVLNPVSYAGVSVHVKEFLLKKISGFIVLKVKLLSMYRMQAYVLGDSRCSRVWWRAKITSSMDILAL